MSRTWCGLAVLLLPALLTSMDLSILFVAGPTIARALDPTATQWLWMMDVYGFVMAGLLITMGGLGDRIGRRRLLLIGSALFGAASAVIAFAPTPELLILARALLGVGGATLAPSTLSLIRGMFADEGRRRAAVGAWTIAFSGGSVAGPIVGGLLLERFWWGSIFLINVPVMLVLLVAAPFLIAESKDSSATGFDLIGAVTSLVAVLSLVFALKRLAEHGPDPIALAALAAGAGFAAVFARRQALVDVSLLRVRAFSAAVGANTVVALAAAGMGVLAFTFMQAVHGLSPLQAALWALPTFAGTLAGAALATAVAPRVRPAVLLAAGLAATAAGFAVIAALSGETGLWVFVGGYTILTTGIGVTGTVANALILTTAPPERAGAAAGISETSTELGAALGIALLGTIANATYRAATGAETVVSAATADGAALAAFTRGVGNAALASVILLAAVAITTALALRNDPARER